MDSLGHEPYIFQRVRRMWNQWETTKFAVKHFSEVSFYKPRKEKILGNVCHISSWVTHKCIYIYIHICPISMYIVISYWVASPVQIIGSSPEGKKTSSLNQYLSWSFKGQRAMFFFPSFLSRRRIWAKVLRQWTARKGLDCSTSCIYLSMADAREFLSGDPTTRCSGIPTYGHVFF